MKSDSKIQNPIQIWLREKAMDSKLKVTPISFSQSREWRVDGMGYLSHISGQFFRMVGVEHHNPVHKAIEFQPLIDQPEIGMLCYVVTRKKNLWWILLQAKVEPGNVYEAQVAPTVQATKSNYTAVHKGKPVPYFTLSQNDSEVLYNQLQSEQNSRFLGKLNANKVVYLSEKISPQNSFFRWHPLQEALSMLGESNLVNTDSRSVLACWLFSNPEPLKSLEKENIFCEALLESGKEPGEEDPLRLKNWLVELNQRHPHQRKIFPLQNLSSHWQWDECRLYSKGSSNLEVRQIQVQCRGREVQEWDQPIFKTKDLSQLITTLCFEGKKISFLLQARLESGNRCGFELTTTIQSENHDKMSLWEKKHLDLLEKEGSLLVDFENSEEGGRFDHCISQYKIYSLDSAEKVEPSPFHIWVTLKEISRWIGEPNYFTNELRSSLSALLSFKSLKR